MTKPNNFFFRLQILDCGLLDVYGRIQTDRKPELIELHPEMDAYPVTDLNRC